MTEFARVIDLAALGAGRGRTVARRARRSSVTSERLTWSDVEPPDTTSRRRVSSTSASSVGDRVAVARPKNNESFEAVHAILRAGAVVVPIDPLAPPAVARQILADADVVCGDRRHANDRADSTRGRARTTNFVVSSQPGSGGDDRVLAWDAVVGGEHFDAVAAPRGRRRRRCLHHLHVGYAPVVRRASFTPTEVAWRTP